MSSRLSSREHVENTVSGLAVGCVLEKQCQGYQSGVCWKNSVKVTSRVCVGKTVSRLPVECMLGTQCQGYQSSECWKNSGSPKRSLSFKFPHQNPLHATPLPLTSYMPSPSHSSRFYHPKSIGWAVQIIKFLLRTMESVPNMFIPCAMTAS